jgi:hypothetical protein
MRILGMDGLVRKCLAENERLLGSGRDFSIKSAARRLTTGQAYAASAARDGEYPFPPRYSLSPEKGEVALRTAVAKTAEALPGLRAYNEYLSRRSDRGFERGSWFRHLGEE